MAETNVEEANGNSTTASGSLFQGKQFWLSRNIPQRTRFKELIEQNGGVIRLFEKDAEIKLVDHVRKNLTADTFSYSFVEDSVRIGRLQNLENYRAGPSASRPVGATNIPSRGHKVSYTLQDDQSLWDWMQSYEDDPNAHVSGNRIYQELALVNPRHTYQSYRDRYLKRLRGRPRPGGMAQSTAPTTQENNQRSPTSTPTATAAAAAAVASSSRQRSPQGPRTALRTPEFRKRKRTPSPHNSDHTDSSGGDIPARKRRATGSPGSDAKTKTPEIPQQNQEIPSRRAPPPPQTIIPIFDEEIANKRNTEKGKAPERAPEKTAEQEPEREPEPEREKAPEQPLEEKSEQNPRSPSPAANEDYEPEPIDPNFLELPFLPSSPGSSEPEEQPEQSIDAWIDNRLRTGIAKTEDQIIEALRCTSMDPQLADQVLKHLVAGEGIPKNVAGVWTAEDDKCIEGRDTRDIEKVLEKHGPEFFNSRWQYLDMARTAGLEKGQEDGIAEL